MTRERRPRALRSPRLPAVGATGTALGREPRLVPDPARLSLADVASAAGAVVALAALALLLKADAVYRQTLAGLQQATCPRGGA